MLLTRKAESIKSGLIHQINSEMWEYMPGITREGERIIWYQLMTFVVVLKKPIILCYFGYKLIEAHQQNKTPGSRLNCEFLFTN